MNGQRHAVIEKIVNPNKRSLTVQEDPQTGDLFLELPEELLEEMGWKEGDTLSWTSGDNGSWLIRKSIHEVV